MLRDVVFSPSAASPWMVQGMPSGSIVYSDFTGGLGGADPSLGYSLLGGQYQDGVSVGLQPACDDLAFAGLPGTRGMRTMGQVTNLFSGDSSIARSVTLTAQVYTLQVFGSGSITCSYGTATAASPLIFTATAGATLFTPTGVSKWMLTATAYPVPYVPPGVTQTSTAHNGTSGIAYNMPQNGPVWNQLSTAKPLTLAARIVMGVASEELPQSSYNAIFSASSSGVLSFARYLGTYGFPRGTDGTSVAQLDGTWSRYEQLVLVMQVNTAGTQFRVGVYRVAAKTWSWSSWAAFDGSFNPSAVYQKLMIAFGNNYPMWHIVDWMADYQATEADIKAAVGVV